jgi:hypothetical protein
LTSVENAKNVGHYTRRHGAGGNEHPDLGVTRVGGVLGDSIGGEVVDAEELDDEGFARW